jgi:type I restriction enzyme S subunit
MSRIDELIDRLCPGGVQFSELRELATYTRGLTYGKNDEQLNGAIRVLRSNNITLSTNSVNFDDVRTVSESVRVRQDQWLRANDILISAASGSKAHVGKVAYIREDIEYCFGGFMAVLRTYGRIDSRFLFHLLVGRTFYEYLESALATTTINNLNASIMNAFRVPVPPMAVQLEIVKILDSFAELKAGLEAKLDAELAARRRQSQHYRHALLSFRDQMDADAAKQAGTRWSSLRDLVGFINGKPHERLVNNEGDIALMTSKFISTQGKSSRFVKRQDVLTPALANDIALVMSDLPNGRALARAYFVDQSNRYAANQRVCLLRVLEQERVEPRFLFYVVNRNEQLLHYDSGVDQTHLKKEWILQIQVPVPPLEEQRRIVAILDQFDALVNDLSIGLIAEVKARRQQYEYYRDRLLTFREAA